MVGRNVPVMDELLLRPLVRELVPDESVHGVVDDVQAGQGHQALGPREEGLWKLVAGFLGVRHEQRAATGPSSHAWSSTRALIDVIDLILKDTA